MEERSQAAVLTSPLEGEVGEALRAGWGVKQGNSEC